VRKITLLLLLCAIIQLAFITASDSNHISASNSYTIAVETATSPQDFITVEQDFDNHLDEVYYDSQLHLSGLNKDVFRLGMIGYYNLLNKQKIKRSDLLTIVDYDQASTKERLFVIDLNNHGLVHHTLVAHGQKTGGNYAKYFSNKSESHQSSLGFYTTAETYEGKYGYSLRLDGFDAGFNCKARDRAIVMHGADYVSRDFIARQGRLGRSWGCLSLERQEAPTVISKIRNGSCIYVHKNDPNFQSKSNWLNESKAVDYWAAQQMAANF